jgi:DNA-binding transcriptional regulator YiaG
MKPMSSTEYAKALDRLGFPNRGFCKFIGVNERTGRDWLSGETRVPGAIAAFLRLALKQKLTADKLIDLFEE